MGTSWTIVAIVTVAVMVAATGVAEGQSDCVSQLVPCAAFLNSTRPSQECCTGIRGVVSTQLQCLCNLYRSPQAFPGVNITQALELPTRCNISNDVSACDASSPGSSAHPPPGVSGRDGNRNGASTSSWMGMPTLVLLSAFTFLY